MKLKTILSLLTMVAAAKLSAISYNAAVDGTTYNGFTVSATGGTPTVKTYNNNAGLTILGVSGGPSGAEIDLGEVLTISFATPQYFNYLTLGLLFDGNEYGDLNEIAAAATPTQYTLQVLSANSADWKKGATLLQTIVNAGTSVAGGQGLWKIYNPFPSVGVLTLNLYPIWTAGQGSKPSNSDFGLVAFKTPDASSTIALSGLAMLAIGFLARRSRR